MSSTSGCSTTCWSSLQSTTRRIRTRQPPYSPQRLGTRSCPAALSTPMHGAAATGCSGAGGGDHGLPR
jgi:hypothetical protein